MTLRLAAFGVVLLFAGASATPAPDAPAPAPWIEVELGGDAARESAFLRATLGETPAFELNVPDGATVRVDSALVLHNMAQETRRVWIRVDAPHMPGVQLALTSEGKSAASLLLAPDERVELGFIATAIPGGSGRTASFAIVVASGPT